MKNLQNHNNIIGTLYALGAFVAWGLLPVYWKLLQQIPALEILAHRIFWSFVFSAVLLCMKGQWGALKLSMSSWSNRIAMIFSALVISANWFIYIWAVNSNHIIDSSLGYYINPLLSILLGVVVLRERMNFWQYVAVLLAAIGVIILTVHYGQVPWIGLALAVTFSTYGLLKKLVHIDSLTGLSLETLFVSPLCVGYIFVKYFQGTGAFGRVSLPLTLLLAFGGVVTAIPLLWFAQAAKMIPLSRVGFVQYISPTISLLLGVFLYHEVFTRIHLISFGCIWVALALYTVSQTPFMKRLQPGWAHSLSNPSHTTTSLRRKTCE